MNKDNSSKVNFYDAKKTLEDYVKEIQGMAPEGVKIYPVEFRQRTEPVTITHMVESAQLNKGQVLDMFDLFCEFYPEKNFYGEKGVYTFANNYHFIHRGLAQDNVTPKKTWIKVGYSKGAAVISASGYGKIGPHITITFETDKLDERDVDFNKSLYNVFISVKESEVSSIEQLASLGVVCEEDLSAHTWDTLAGYEKTKQDIVDKIIRPNLASKVFQNLRKVTRKHPEQTTYNCYLLSGTYGVGKTISGKIIANYLNHKFFEVSMQSVFEKWYGESSRNLGGIFKYARKLGKVLLFLDELDCLSGNRDDRMHEESRRVLAVLMTETAKTRAGDGLVIVGATNKPQNLDGAIKRRFKNEIRFPLPSHEDLIEIYKHYAKHLPAEDIKELAKKSEGFSPYDVSCVCEDAERRFVAGLLEKRPLRDKIAPPKIGYYIQSLKNIEPTLGTANPERYIL